MGKVYFTRKTTVTILILFGVILISLFYLGNLRLSHSKTDDANNQLRVIAAALDRRKQEVGRYPSTDEGLSALLRSESGDGYFDNPEFMIDPWGNEISYDLVTGSGEQLFQLRSYGENGSDDGGDLDDIERTGG